jgi:hypothetical protein
MPGEDVLSSYQPIDLARIALDKGAVMGIQTFLQPKDLLADCNAFLLGFLSQIFNTNSGLQYPPVELIRGKELIVLASDLSESEEDLMG